MLLWTFNSIFTLPFFYISKGLVRYLECPLPHSLSVDQTIGHRIGGMWLFGTTLDCSTLCPVASTTRQLNSSTMALGRRCCQEFIYLKTVFHCSSANFRCLTLSIVVQQFDAYHACPETVMIRHGQVYSNLWCCVHSLSSIKTISGIFIYPWATVMSIVINTHYDLHHFRGLTKFNNLCEMVH